MFPHLRENFAFLFSLDNLFSKQFDNEYSFNNERQIKLSK